MKGSYKVYKNIPCTLKYQIEVHVRTINFWLLFRPVQAYSILYVYYFSKFFHNCKISFYVIYKVSVKIQVFFKSKGENDHENEKKNIFLVFKKMFDLNNLGHFASVRLFHPVRLLVFRKYATLYGYSILYLYLILKSTMLRLIFCSLLGLFNLSSLGEKTRTNSLSCFSGSWQFYI